MKKRGMSAGMVLLACVAASCGTGGRAEQPPPLDPVTSATQTETRAADVGKLFCGEIQLRWQLPECEYRVVEAVPGEDAFAALYEEIRPWNENEKIKHSFIMAQFFDAGGNYLRTAYGGI